MYDMNQYAKDKMYRAQKLQEARQAHLAANLQVVSKPAILMFSGRKLIITLSVITTFIILLMVMPTAIQAQDKYEAGSADPFYDQMIAYRLGHYYYVIGEYQRAVDYYNEALIGIPEIILVQMSSLRDIYWLRGDAQLKAGQTNAALESYQMYLQLAGTKASVQETEFVGAIINSIANGTVVMEPLEI